MTIVAHATAPTLLSELWQHWTFEPVTALLLVLSAGLYAVGVARLWRRAGRDRGVRWWQVTCYAGGLISLAAALLSPLAWISERLFSMHMTQHEILMLVAAPPLVFGRPAQAMLWAFSGGWRMAVARAVTRPMVARSCTR